MRGRVRMRIPLRSVHVLDNDQLDLVELLLSRSLEPSVGFESEFPLIVPATVHAAPGDELELHDSQGVAVAYVQVLIGPPAITGRLIGLEGVLHDDALDLRRSPQGVRSCAAGRPVVGVFLVEPLRMNQVHALVEAARTRGAIVLMLCPLGAHDAGEAAWYGRAAAARATADLVSQALGGRRTDVALAAVPRPPRPGLYDRVLRSYGAEPIALPGPLGELPAQVSVQLARFAQPKHGRGVVVFFTGLSGSGKSTVAHAVAARIMEGGSRRVTLLDGDVVRRNLSSELGFSAEHRDLNIRRIAWVAAEVARHGGIAIACPIAPYEQARRAARALVEAVGAVFLLVHISTSLEVCEARDRKGLYARARIGELPHFTGISDPYEPPTDADVILDTAAVPLDECARSVLIALRTFGVEG